MEESSRPPSSGGMSVPSACGASSGSPLRAAAGTAGSDATSRDATSRDATFRDAAPRDAARGASPQWTRRGTRCYRRISLALFLAGFATFSLIYCVQPLLPEFAQEFSVGAAESSVALSLTTGLLAFSILCAGAVSEALGRRGLMFWAMAAAAGLNICVAFAPSWHVLLVERALEGLVLGGVPAVAMAYLAEEIHPGGLGFAMGLYVGGTAFGGMFGRVATGMITQYTSWRMAVGVLGGLGLAAALGFIALLPASRNFTPRPGFNARHHLAAWGGHLRSRGLPLLFLIGCLVMGAFVTVYNYSTFRLLQPPYGLTQAHVSLIFTAYLFGIAASSTAGALSDRIGRGPVLVSGLCIAGLGLGLTCLTGLVPIIGGIVILTIGFFVTHSVASGWVGRLAEGSKGHAASLYLLAYYMGSSIMGTSGGWFWAEGGWPALALFTGTLLAGGLLAALALRSRTARPEAALDVLRN
ncbi:major facilitator superfamily MFS_1 [Desulfovibrio sp. X2]|uniref:MFS transporter n=1 Tax=Desulfovibrio sp. X2 TaxID=941449 RepID=UPI00035884E6|nr:MFS transporter [Desulfovibrio sp. X2]EPR43654.1 major facilitator superfamily MFS_1 [Desulfovibrio sp. X2]